MKELKQDVLTILDFLILRDPLSAIFSEKTSYDGARFPTAGRRILLDFRVAEAHCVGASRAKMASETRSNTRPPDAADGFLLTGAD